MRRPYRGRFAPGGGGPDGCLALKFLPAEMSNHPNIRTVYDIDEFEGHPFIAMEMLEGRKLAFGAVVSNANAWVIPNPPKP